MATATPEPIDGVVVVPNTTISPKVTAGAVAGGVFTAILVVLAAALPAVTTDMISWAGPFAPALLIGIGALATQITAYLKKDHSRDFDIPVAATGAPRTDVSEAEALANDPTVNALNEPDVPDVDDEPVENPAPDLVDSTDEAAPETTAEVRADMEAEADANAEVDQTPVDDTYEARH